MTKSATEWEKVYDTCCGIDVHKKLLVACLNRGTKQEIREFGATTRELLELLEEEGIEFVSVEPPRELKRDKKVTLDFF